MAVSGMTLERLFKYVCWVRSLALLFLLMKPLFFKDVPTDRSAHYLSNFNSFQKIIPLTFMDKVKHDAGTMSDGIVLKKLGEEIYVPLRMKNVISAW